MKPNDTATKKYLDIDVYEAAKKRIRHTINLFDSVLVAFSGGKDSLTTLNLVQEVYNEMGIKEKVKVFFRDEELIPDDVIDFVQEIAESGKYDFRYYAIPLKSNKFILGKTYDYVQFDKNRRWLRQPPEYAITTEEGDDRVFSQYEADEFICENEKGKVAIITGIRADESLIRLRSCINKRNENYINATKSKRIKLVKPIYDWTERDVFVYFCKQDIKYSRIYDAQMLNGQRLRVATPLHSESAKRFDKLKTLYPTFYQQLIDLFPEMIVQGMYYKEYDGATSYDEYPHTAEGIFQFIDENVEESQKALAYKRVSTALGTRERNIKKGQTHNFGGYPLKYIFDCIVKGQYKRVIQPKKDCTAAEIEYEKEAKNEI